MNHYSYAQFSASMQHGYDLTLDYISAAAVSCMQVMGFGCDVLNDYLAITEEDHIVVFVHPFRDAWKACNVTLRGMRVVDEWRSGDTYDTQRKAFAAALRRAEARRREVLETGR